MLMLNPVVGRILRENTVNIYPHAIHSLSEMMILTRFLKTGISCTKTEITLGGYSLILSSLDYNLQSPWIHRNTLEENAVSWGVFKTSKALHHI